MNVSRLILDHPALGTAGGASLHAAIEAIYTKIGNSMADRFFYIQNLAVSGAADCDHNFNTNFNNLRIDVYSWNESTGLLTFLTESTTPKRSEIAVIAKVGDTEKQITVTNNSSGEVDLGIVVLHDPIEINELTDVDTAGMEDGQALVYDLATNKWKPGASGDSSFKLQSITDPNLTMKGGYLILDDGRELATFNSTYGADLTLNLDTILGSSPVNATAYYLYIDLNALGSEQTETATGRKLYKVEQAQFVLMTTKPEGNLLKRYVPIGVIMSATSGTVWSGSGAAFRTLAYRRHEPIALSQAPLIYGDFSKTVSSVGTSGQIKQGHVLTTKSFRAALLDTAKLSFFNLAEDSNDEYGSRNLTNNGTTPFTGTNILGATNKAASLNGSSQYFSSTSSVFNPGSANDWAVGGWFKATDWTPATGYTAFFQGGASDRSFQIFIDTAKIIFNATNTAGSWDYSIDITSNLGFTDNTWHHLAMRYDATLDILYAYVDGLLAGQASGVTTIRAASSAVFLIGVWGGAASQFFNGQIEDCFFANNLSLTDNDILKIASTSIAHNKNVLASRQKWEFNYYPLGLDPVSDLSKVIVDMSDPNILFADFSQLAATDKVDIKLFDTGLNNALVAQNFEAEYIFNATGQLTDSTTSYPTYLPEEVRNFAATQKDASNNVWPLDITGLVYLTSDSQKYMRGNLDGLPTPPSASAPVRICVGCRAMGATVGDADSTIRGLISAGKQLISGLKKWLGGISSVEYVGTNPEVGGSSPFQLTDEHKRVQSINPAGAITVKLPTTGIKTGERFRIENRSTNLVTIQSSGGNELTIIGKGFAEFRSLADNPTGTADWDLVNVFEKVTYTTTFTFTGGAVTPTASFTLTRNNKQVTLCGGQQAFVTSVNASGYAQSDTDIPTRFCPEKVPVFCAAVLDNGSGAAAAGMVVISPTGNISIYKTFISGSFTGGGSSYTGLNNEVNTTYNAA